MVYYSSGKTEPNCQQKRDHSKERSTIRKVEKHAGNNSPENVTFDVSKFVCLKLMWQ